MRSIAKIDSYDGDRILESGQGFFVGEDLLVTKYSLVNQATNVKVQPFDENRKYTARSFVAFDRINDLIILKVDSISREPIELHKDTLPNFAKSFYVATKNRENPAAFYGEGFEPCQYQGDEVVPYHQQDSDIAVWCAQFLCRPGKRLAWYIPVLLILNNRVLLFRQNLL